MRVVEPNPHSESAGVQTVYALNHDAAFKQNELSVMVYEGF